MPDRILLVCSPGGHLHQMLALEPCWHELEPIWVTLPGVDVDHTLAGFEVVLGHGPTNRSLLALARNLVVAWKTVRRLRPKLMLSTGAGLAVPFFWVGRLHGVRLVYVESLTRTKTMSLSGRLVYPFTDAFFVQWPGLVGSRRRARYVGSLL